MSFFEVTGLSKIYGDHQIFSNLNLKIDKGEIVAVMGRSGCGKTTLLRCLAGLEDHNSGSVTLGGRNITDVDPYHRDLALMAQNAADVIPWLRSGDMIRAAIRKHQYLTNLASIDENNFVQEYARAARLPLEVLGQKGRTLSGGQRQRLSLARVLAERPALVLADEPLSNLDESMANQLIDEMRQFFKKNGMTVLYVTHDANEAKRIADIVIEFRSLYT